MADDVTITRADLQYIETVIFVLGLSERGKSGRPRGVWLSPEFCAEVVGRLQEIKDRAVADD